MKEVKKLIKELRAKNDLYQFCSKGDEVDLIICKLEKLVKNGKDKIR